MESPLTREELKELHRIRPLRVRAELFAWWAAVLLVLQLGVTLGLSFWLLPLVVLMGCIQNAFILWTHEGAHGNLHRDRKTNDFWTDLLICGPVGVNVDAYRWHHNRHHKYLGDPTEEIELSAFECIRGGQLWRHVARHLFGVVALRLIFRGKRFTDSKFPPPPGRTKAAWAGFFAANGVLCLLCALQGVFWMVFILWVFPLFTIAVMISNFRTIVEHQPSSDVCDSGAAKVPAVTRVVRCGPLERLLICPLGFYYHYEHHLWPGIPYHRLPEVRRLLTERDFYDEARGDFIYSDGYLKTVWRLSRRPGFQIPFLPRS